MTSQVTSSELVQSYIGWTKSDEPDQTPSTTTELN